MSPSFARGRLPFQLAVFAGVRSTGLRRLREAGCRPASTLLGVARLFHPAILVEIEATAMA
jgi:enamine deaminase RidA (YjgF/YER057c/UK114 family)